MVLVTVNAAGMAHAPIQRWDELAIHAVVHRLKRDTLRVIEPLAMLPDDALFETTARITCLLVGMKGPTIDKT